MADAREDNARPADPVGRALFAVSRAFVLAGGVLLVLSALLTTVSIVSHAVFQAPIRGQFELVTFGTSWAIYLFLPYCQMVKGNVVVDFFFAGARPRTKHVLDALGSLLYAGIAALLVWRMTVGGFEVAGAGQAGAVTGIPYWWSFPIALACLGLLFLVTLYTLWSSLREARS